LAKNIRTFWKLEKEFDSPAKWEWIIFAQILSHFEQILTFFFNGGVE
jgi:hypothetical protein